MSDAILKRLKNISVEEAWGVLRGKGYHNQFEGDWTVIWPDSAMTGRVVTAAAIIMIAVFGAFAIGNERALAMMGVGFAAAIFIDAFIIRLLLLPAVMHLAGPAMWWIPDWLDRRLPHLNIERPDGHEP
ncbi:MAG TPA: MMPL family transporter, partial [Anaerolineales bacterium]|nr:MMPL family transporter [Anaerolineales bacterium]